MTLIRDRRLDFYEKEFNGSIITLKELIMVMKKKQVISIFQLNPNINELHSILNERKGNWIHFNSLPSYPNEHF